MVKNQSEGDLHWFYNFKMVNRIPVFVSNTQLVPAKQSKKEGCEKIWAIIFQLDREVILLHIDHSQF